MSLRVQVELVKQFQNADIAGAINDDAQRAIAAVLADIGQRCREIVLTQRWQGQQKVIRQVHGVIRLSSPYRFALSIDERSTATELPGSSERQFIITLAHIDVEGLVWCGLSDGFQGSRIECLVPRGLQQPDIK